jgi:hypothetical protein
MNRPPSFDELFDEPLPDEERDRLHAAHDLLVEAGPPEELPPWLAQPPTPWQAPLASRRSPAVVGLRRYQRGRRYAMLSLAAAIAVIAFVLGYSAKPHQTFAKEFTRTMHGTAAAPNAEASLIVGKVDKAGNWPMELHVAGLRALPRGQYYELFLTRGGKLAASCGTFRVVAPDRLTTVRLNAPYDFRKFNGWVVASHTRGPRERVVLTT